MVKKADVPQVALDTALSLAATTGWRDLTLRDVSEASGVTLVQLHDVYRSKDAILDAFVRQIDEAVLAGDSADLEDESARDRLFDVLMRRFDALAPHKAAVCSVMKASACDVSTGVSSLCRLMGSMRWMLEAAGIDSSGLMGRLRAKGLALVYLDAMRTWMKDDSQDMAATMSVLDKRLGQADEAVATLCSFGRPKAKPEEPAGEAA
jgi:AcrR family transcriptional regulator